MRQSFFDYCRLYQKQNLLDEWDAERNLPLTPQTVTYGSHKSAWWRCENGHEWKAAIYTRSDGARCPYCTGRKVMVGFNDLATQSPELARQWDYKKNVPLVPADISAGSHRSVWWRCEKGHSWRASIHSRASGCGCPVCAGRQILVGENDLATVDPELAQEWDTMRNEADPTGRSDGDREKGLVGLRAWTPLAGGGLCTDEQAKWLPILFRKTGAARLQ